MDKELRKLTNKLLKEINHGIHCHYSKNELNYLHDNIAINDIYDNLSDTMFEILRRNDYFK